MPKDDVQAPSPPPQPPKDQAPQPVKQNSTLKVKSTRPNSTIKAREADQSSETREK